MKKRDSIHVILAAAALLLATAACTKDEPTDGTRLPEGQYPLEIARITLGVEGGEAQPWGAPATRVSEKEDGNSSKFDANDKFAVQIDDKGEVGTYTVQDDGSVEAENPLYWSDRDEAHTVTAWYPATDGTLDLSDQQTNGTLWRRYASRLRTMYSARCRASNSIPIHSVPTKKAKSCRARTRAG